MDEKPHTKGRIVFFPCVLMELALLGGQMNLMAREVM